SAQPWIPASRTPAAACSAGTVIAAKWTTTTWIPRAHAPATGEGRMKNPLDEHSDAAFFTRFGLVIFILGALAVGFMAAGYAIEKKYQEPDTGRLAMDADKRTRPVGQVITSNEQLAQVTPAATGTTGPATPKGGQPALTDDDLRKAIEFMMKS